MKNIHLTDEILQDYIFNKLLNENAKQHLANCFYCKEQLKAYQHLYLGLKTLPKETFSFDTSFLVMQKIETQHKKVKIRVYLFYTLLLGSFLVPIYFISPMIVGYFNIKSMSSGAMTLLITGVLGVILFLMIDMFRTQKEKELQFSL